jgi:hypothetical protein
MTNTTSASFATYNVLNPYHAVKWAEKDGLSEKGLVQESSVLKESTVSIEENAWEAI